MSSAPCTNYTIGQRHTPEQELSVLAPIYKLAIKRFEEAEAANEDNDKGSGEEGASSRCDEDRR